MVKNRFKPTQSGQPVEWKQTDDYFWTGTYPGRGEHTWYVTSDVAVDGWKVFCWVNGDFRYRRTFDTLEKAQSWVRYEGWRHWC